MEDNDRPLNQQTMIFFHDDEATVTQKTQARIRLHGYLEIMLAQHYTLNENAFGRTLEAVIPALQTHDLGKSRCHS